MAEEAALLVWVIQMHPWGALAFVGSVLVRRHRTRAGIERGPQRQHFSHHLWWAWPYSVPSIQHPHVPYMG